MDFVLYLLGLLFIFGFGILAYQDRFFGIIGIITGFVFAAFLVHDGSIIIAGTTYTGASSSFELSAIVIFVMVATDVSIYNHVNKTGQSLTPKPVKD